MFAPSGPALIRYETPEYVLLKPGAYVLCAVSGERIALEDLKYWSAEFQEAYRGAEEASAAFAAGGAKKMQGVVDR